MKKYKLLKDLPYCKVGDVFGCDAGGNWSTENSPVTPWMQELLNAQFDNINWFQPLPEQETQEYKLTFLNREFEALYEAPLQLTPQTAEKVGEAIQELLDHLQYKAPAENNYDLLNAADSAQRAYQQDREER